MIKRAMDNVKDENGFVFTATATIVSVILGLTILFMTNTIRSESVRASELYAAQEAYWQAVDEVQMAANMIQANGTSINSHLNTYWPNISITQIDQTNMIITSDVLIGSDVAGAQRSASVNITSPLYSIIEQVTSGDFDITGFSSVDGGNLYIGGDVELNSWWFFKLAYVGRDSTVNFYIPTGYSVDPLTPSGGDDYTVTNISPISLPGFDNSAYTPLINYASGITVDNASIGEWEDDVTIDRSTHPSGLDLQTSSFTGGGILSGLGNGIFVNGDLTIDGTSSSGTYIVDNNTASNPGFIVVDGELEIEGDWFYWIPTITIPDNVIIITTDDIEFEYANFGNSTSYPSSTWSNYVNEIYTLGDLETSSWSYGSEMFGQFHAMGSVSQMGWASNMDGVLYVPNASYDLSTLFNAFTDFEGTMYLKSTVNNRFSWLSDINLDSRAALGRGLPGGLIQPVQIPWIILASSLREI